MCYLLQPAGLLGLLVLAYCCHPVLAENTQPQAHAFKVSIQSKLDVATDGPKQTLDAETRLHYTWRTSGPQRELTLDSLYVKVSNNGMPMVESSMNKDKFVSIEQGTTNELLFDRAPAGIKNLLQDGFRAPLYHFQYDTGGNRAQQKVVAGPAAKSLVNNGMIANALIFHPFHPGQDNWQSDAEFSMGNGGYATGKLDYRKTSGDKYDIRGTLINAGYRQPETDVTVKDARYVVAGEETYNPQQKEWSAGRLAIDVSFKMFLSDKAIGTSTGKLDVTFEALPAVR